MTFINVVTIEKLISSLKRISKVKHIMTSIYVGSWTNIYEVLKFLLMWGFPNNLY